MKSSFEIVQNQGAELPHLPLPFASLRCLAKLIEKTLAKLQVAQSKLATVWGKQHLPTLPAYSSTVNYEGVLCCKFKEKVVEAALLSKWREKSEKRQRGK